jgi:hypothetical protein
VLSVLFTRLGEAVVSRGRLFLPMDEPPHYDYDMSEIPVIELKNGRKVVLDLQRRLKADFITRFRGRYPEYMVFQPQPKEPMAKALDRLWPLCGYYRVYGRDKAFEGGRDLKIKISADWLVWPSADDWNKGQPRVINLAPAPDDGTPEPWVKFLADHNIIVTDLYAGELLAETPRREAPVNNFTVIDVSRAGPSAFAAALVKSFGFSPRVGVKVDMEKGRVTTGGESLDGNGTPAVYWDTGKERTILEYGGFPTEELAALRQTGVRVISSARDVQSVLKSILASQGIELNGPLVLNGSSSGGPSIALTIAGESFKWSGRSYLFTPVKLPSNMTGLDPSQTVVVLRYDAAAIPAAKPAAAPPAEAAGPGAPGGGAEGDGAAGDGAGSGPGPGGGAPLTSENI